MAKVQKCVLTNSLKLGVADAKKEYRLYEKHMVIGCSHRRQSLCLALQLSYDENLS